MKLFVLAAVFFVSPLFSSSNSTDPVPEDEGCSVSQVCYQIVDPGTSMLIFGAIEGFLVLRQKITIKMGGQSAQEKFKLLGDKEDSTGWTAILGLVGMFGFPGVGQLTALGGVLYFGLQTKTAVVRCFEVMIYGTEGYCPKRFPF